MMARLCSTGVPWPGYSEIPFSIAIPSLVHISSCLFGNGQSLCIYSVYKGENPFDNLMKIFSKEKKVFRVVCGIKEEQGIIGKCKWGVDY
jgi:hypothetical protein